jgi:hypothetical protein
MIGIVVRAHTGRQHEVITRKLSFRAHAACNPPDAGMDPVNRARNSSERLPKAVVTRDMGKFVKQHRAATVIRPVIGAGG